MTTDRQLTMPSPDKLRENEECLAREEELRKQRAASLAVAKLARDLGRRYYPERVSLDAYRIYHDAQKPVIERLRAIEERLSDFIASGSGLVLYGSVGTGKDHLLAGMLYKAAGLGLNCRWFNCQELYGRFRVSMDKKARENEADIIADLAAPDVLGLSDPIPPADTPSAYNLQQLYRLLDLRYREVRPTWITINVLDVEDAKGKLTAPCFDRLNDGAELLRCFWPSFRGRHAAAPAVAPARRTPSPS